MKCIQFSQISHISCRECNCKQFCALLYEKFNVFFCKHTCSSIFLSGCYQKSVQLFKMEQLFTIGQVHSQTIYKV